MAILSITRSVGAAFVTGFIFGAIFWAVGDFITHHRPPTNLLTCQFKNMTKKYTTAQAEAEAQTIMITVTEGDRTFMFRRDNLTACYDANETP